MNLLLLTFIIANMSVANAQTSPPVPLNEEECAMAVLGYLKQEKVIGTGNDDLCIKGLDDLPEVSIGLGSDTFPTGDHEDFSPPDKTKRSLGIIKDLFASGPNSFSFAGWADGQNNKMEKFDAIFLQGKSTFTITELKVRMAEDPLTLKAILAKLNEQDEKKEITYAGNPAISLIRNHYLARERARAVCSVTLGAEKCKNDSILEGFASPQSEEAGHLACGNRRKAVLKIHGTDFSGNKAQKDGTFRPQFKIPEEAEDRRNLQLAAGLNFFQRLTKTAGSSDETKFTDATIETSMAPDCQKDPKTKSYMKDNFRLFLSHTKKMAEKSSNSALKTAVFKGDYKSVKAKLESLIEVQKKRTLLPNEQADMDLIDTAMTGYSKKIDEPYTLIGTYAEAKLLGERKLKDSEFSVTQMYYNNGGRVKYFAIYKGTVYELPNGMENVYSQADLKKGTIVYPTGPNSGSPNAAYRNFPNASLASPSTDNLNCLSSAAAVEDMISSQTPNMILEPEAYTNESGELKIEMLSKSLPPTGWECKFCHNGVKINKPDPTRSQDSMNGYYKNYSKNAKTLSYDSRESNAHSELATKTVINQKDDKELTVGSMKALGIYNISRSSFTEGQCPSSKSVCDCIKALPVGEGQLDIILASKFSKKILMPTVEEQNKSRPSENGFRTKTAMATPKDQCIFVPPVPHTCKVRPNGTSSDRPEKSGEGLLSCELFKKIKTHKLIGANFDEKKAKQYSAIVLGNSMCSKDQAPEIEEKACALELKKAKTIKSQAAKTRGE